jgi:carbamate kinase
MAPDAHGGWRRVVPSPAPYSIVETPIVRQLVADGVIVIASGGRGVPVIEDGPRLVGVEGVVDKDLASAILASEVEATTLLILTDVPAVQRGFGTEEAEDIHELTVADARALLEAGELDSGSMGPKVRAAIDFCSSGGRRAIIADLADGPAALEGRGGTVIRP